VFLCASQHEISCVKVYWFIFMDESFGQYGLHGNCLKRSETCLFAALHISYNFFAFGHEIHY
jgi:hypothetical protein